MDEHKDNINISLIIYRIHMIMYVTVTLFQVQLVWVSKGISFYVGLGLLIYFACMMIIESVAIVGEREVISMTPPLFYFYRATQLLAAILLFFIAANRYSAAMGVCFLIMYSLEILYFCDFEEAMARIKFYAVVLIPFITAAFIWTVNQSGSTLEHHFQLIVVTLTVSALIVMLGEALTKIWKYYQRRILDQKRNMERLADTNKVLKEHQEKVNKVNELLGLQKVQLQAANRRINNAHKEMLVQNQVARVISASLDLERMTEDVCRLLQEKMELDYVCIVLEPFSGQDDRGRMIAYRTSKGDEFALDLWKSIQHGQYDTILDIKTTFVENHGRENRSIRYLNSIMSIPMLSNEERIGNLIVGMMENNAFIHNCEFYETIGGQISVGVANATLYQQMEDMAIRDGLTGIYNRRYLTEVLTAKIEEAKRHGTHVSLVLFDIDKFKMVNDTFGHTFGDIVIKYVADLLAKTAEENGGMAGRYGGEEFVIAFPNKGVDETYELVKMLHESIREGEIERDGKSVKVRVSSGIACYPETCSKPDDLLTRADWAMYHSKRNGRDQITIDNDQISSKM